MANVFFIFYRGKTKLFFRTFYYYHDVRVFHTSDWLNTETIKRPPTILIIPDDPSSQNFVLDIKYTDFTGVLDIPNGYPRSECYIIPPYKPYMHATLYSPNASVRIYALRGP